jgi:preprotein translocase subunit YajC
MNSLVLYLLMGVPQGGEGGAAGGIMSFLPFLAIIAIFYFLIIRPQGKKQKETQKMLSSLKKNDRVVTIGAIHGTVQTVREQTVIVKVDDNTKIEISRSAVATIVASHKEEDKQDDESPDTENEKK